MIPCHAEQGCAGIRAVFSVKEDGNALEGEEGVWFLGRGQFIPLFLVCYFALLMSKCNKL